MALLSVVILSSCGDDESLSGHGRVVELCLSQPATEALPEQEREAFCKLKADEAINGISSGKTTACDIGTLAGAGELTMAESFELRKKPNGEKIKNEKASSILGETQYHQVDNTTTVKPLCVSQGWTMVQIVSPEWLNFVKGWVPDTSFRKIERLSDGSRTYVEADFLWDDDTATYKKQIVAAVNRISRETAGCSDIEPASVALSPTRSAPGKPVMFVTCGFNAGKPFNVWFEP